MNPPTKPTAPRMPRARVATAWRDRYIDKGEMPAAVIPTATAQQARKLAAFFNLTPEDQHETIVLITEDGNISPNDQATAILAAITGGR